MPDRPCSPTVPRLETSEVSENFGSLKIGGEEDAAAMRRNPQLNQPPVNGGGIGIAHDGQDQRRLALGNPDGPLGVDRRAEVRDVAAQEDCVHLAGLCQDPFQDLHRAVQVGDTDQSHTSSPFPATCGNALASGHYTRVNS